MRKSTLAANSLILSLGSTVSIAIIAYLLKLNLIFRPVILTCVGGLLFIAFTAGFALYLRRKFGSNRDKKRAPSSVLVNETWLLKH